MGKDVVGFIGMDVVSGVSLSDVYVVKNSSWSVEVTGIIEFGFRVVVVVWRRVLRFSLDRVFTTGLVIVFWGAGF